MIGVCCHDAGGSQVISSYIRRGDMEAIYCIDGPAVKIFNENNPNIQRVTMEILIEKSDWILCGTSWNSNLEWEMISKARLNGKKVVVFLEHWVNYCQRFEREGVINLPDEIWVGDIDARTEATKCFPKIPIKLIENPYFLDLKEAYRDKLTASDLMHSGSILYICENIADHMLKEYGDEYHLGFTEYEALCFFLSNVKKLNFQTNNLVIRPHPSDKNPNKKYLWAKKMAISKGLSVRISQKTLIEDILESVVVVGAESMAMAVALQFDKRVISSIPIKDHIISLPQKNIEHLLTMI